MTHMIKSAIAAVFSIFIAGCTYMPDIKSGPAEAVRLDNGKVVQTALTIVSDQNGFGPTMMIAETYDENRHHVSSSTIQGRGSAEVILANVVAPTIGAIGAVQAASAIRPDTTVNNNLSSSNANSSSNSSSNAGVTFTAEQRVQLTNCQPVTVGAIAYRSSNCR